MLNQTTSGALEMVKSWGVGVLVAAGWVIVAGYTVFQLGSMPNLTHDLPVVRGPEVVIDVGARLAQAEETPHALPVLAVER